MNNTKVAVTYDEAVAELTRATQRIKDAQVELEASMADKARCEKVVVEFERAMAMGLSADATAIVHTILDVKMPADPNRMKWTPEVGSVIASAITDIRTGGLTLSREYFGVKRYDGWDSQREDHPYGYGPRHGFIWFSVGLKHARPSRELTAEERAACVQFLTALWDNRPGAPR